MKLHLHLLAWVLATFMVLAYAAPDKAPPENHPAAETQEDPIGKFAAPGEEAVGDLLLQAMSLLGVAYRFGGSTPSAGLDCSGFIQYVFKKSLRVNLPRTAAEMANAGRPVEKSELAPGDLVFFNTRGFQYSHVGIYMGGGKFIHSPRTGKSVEVSNMNQSYWTARYNGARRVSRGSAAGVVRDDSEPTPKLLAKNSVKAVEGKEPAAKVVCRKGRRCKQEITAAEEPKAKVACRKGRRCKQEEVAEAKGRRSNGDKAVSSKAGKSSRSKKAEETKPSRSKSSDAGRSGKEARKKKEASSRHS
ncbi:C40 family peptidase [Pseudogulbenkiania sp. MAI-1]|uniref:C40 family peptidase n=1 Tax=Pseudogulbenkiania sp. MAI-1 TaxID=990370 RepID=UPI00045E6E9C|nr:C40 family peptidase [Pseudogulbenkiania sp. MAI-1]